MGIRSGSRYTRVVMVLVFAASSGILGCGAGGPTTYPVTGKIDLAGGDVTALAGSTIEVALQSDPNVRASGEIKQDGGFSLQTLHAGAILNGALEGSYQVRILLADDDPATKKRATKAIAPRYLHFETSGLRLYVPPKDDVTLKVSPR